MKRKLSFRIYFLLLCVICSLMMTAQGVVGRLGSNRVTDLAGGIANLGFVAFILICARNKEKLDELARRNMGKAALGTILFALIVFLVIGLILSIINEKAFTLLSSDLSFVIGGIYLSLGIQFFIFDKWGKA